MSEQLTELSIVKAQRNQLAANLHDLHVAHQLTLAALAETNARLAAEQERFIALEERVRALERGEGLNRVPVSDNADAAA